MDDKCNHDWENDKTRIDEIIREGDFIGFPVHCTICKLKAVEWFEHICTDTDNSFFEGYL